MNVIDSFVLELNLDPSNFTRGQREAIESLRRFQEDARGAGTAVESQSKKIFNLLTDFRRQSLELIGIFLGGRGIGEFIDYVSRLDATTGRVAKTMGEATSEVSAWQGAIRQVGGTAESATTGLQGLSNEMSRFQLTGQSSILPVLSRLGVSLYDQNHNLKTASALWLDLADAVKDMDPRQATAFLQMIPGANQDMINFALLGRAAMETYIENARRAGTTTRESAAAAQEYQKQLSLLDQAATSAGRSLLTVLAPAATATLNAFSRVINALRSGVIDAGQRAVGVENAGALRWDNKTGRFELQHPPTISQHVDMLGNPEETDAEYEKRKAERLEEIRRKEIARMVRVFTPVESAGTSLPPNWNRFLSGLSYLETSQTNARATAGHSAAGFFQFQPATAERAKSAGIADPRFGDYEAQAGATMDFIKKFHPAAAAAIERGDFSAAAADLRGEWPSLPGGSQQQSAERYRTFEEVLRGRSPRPVLGFDGTGASAAAPAITGSASGAGGTVNNEFNIGEVNVNAPNAKDTPSSFREIEPALKRSITAASANSGPQ